MGRKPYSIEEIFTKPPTLRQYEKLDTEVKEVVDDIVRNSLKNNNVLRIGKKRIAPKKDSLWLFSWSDIIEISVLIEEANLIEILKIVYNVGSWEVRRASVFNCFAVYKWISESLKNIAEAEENELGGELSAKEKEAGVEKLERYGHRVRLRNLTNGDWTKSEYYLSLPYERIVEISAMDKDIQEIINKLSR
ncbi:hypothetical protein ACFSTE_13265 [Aquimarina hainanensis]|uniref:Uncharacterized protein n=1 Tax=Aquimarina hainanensis TaxID=1578017 RepID=A0ABW5N861_9FLAO